MAFTASDALGIALITPGTERNTWGSLLNNFSLIRLEEAIANTEAVTVVAGDNTLDAAPFTGVAHKAGIRFTGSPADVFDVIVPPVPHFYFATNDTNKTATVKTTDVATYSTTVPAGSTRVIQTSVDGARDIMPPADLTAVTAQTQLWAQERFPLWGGSAGGTATAIVLTPELSGATVLRSGLILSFLATAGSGAGATVEVGALGTKTILRGTAAVMAGHWDTGDVVTSIYDGTNFKLLSPLKKPIGAIEIRIDALNPAAIEGYGTWTTIGAGRMLAQIGAIPGAGTLDLAENIGASQVTLSVSQIPHTSVSVNLQGGSIQQVGGSATSPVTIIPLSIGVNIWRRTA